MPVKNCEVCGEPFKYKRTSAKYCSAKCRKRAQRGTYKKEKTCPICNKKLITSQGGVKYCSEECRKIAWYANNYRKICNLGRKIDKSIIIQNKFSEFNYCIKCGNIIMKRRGQNKYCEDCAIKELEIRHGRIYKGWADKVKARDNYTCQNPKCGSKHDLEAHHIKPKMQYPELARNLDNGITLCASCHRTGPNAVHRNSSVSQPHTTNEGTQTKLQF